MKFFNLALAGAVTLPMATAVNIRAVSTPIASSSSSLATPAVSSADICQAGNPNAFIPMSSASRQTTPVATPTPSSIRSTSAFSSRTPANTLIGGNDDTSCTNKDDIPNTFIPISSTPRSTSNSDVRSTSSSGVGAPNSTATGASSASAGGNDGSKSSIQSGSSTGTRPSQTANDGKPAITDLPLSTSTYTATQTYTITKCPPEVTNCPVGSVTSTTITEYTTYCPAITAPLTYTVTSTVPCNSCQGGQQTTSATVTIIPASTKSGAIAPTTLGGNSPFAPSSVSAPIKASQSVPVLSPSSTANRPGSNSTFASPQPSANATTSTTSGNRPVASGPTSGATSFSFQSLILLASGALAAAFL